MLGNRIQTERTKQKEEKLRILEVEREKKRTERLRKKEEKLRILEAEREKKRAERLRKKEEQMLYLEKKRLEQVGGAKNSKKYERAFVEKANSMFKGPKDFIIVDKAGNKSDLLKDVVQFKVIQGNRQSTPQAYEDDKEPNKLKADIKMIDSHGNEVGWISHKASPPRRKTPKIKKVSTAKPAIGFNQYARISSRNLKYSPDVVQEIEQFKRDVVKHAPSSKEWPQKKTMWAPITLLQTKNEGIFGMNYGKKLGRDNVTVFGQGEPRIEEKDGIMYLKFSNFSALNGHQELFTDIYEPVFYVRSDSSMSSVVNGVKYKSLGFFIQPARFVSKSSILVSDAQIQLTSRPSLRLRNKSPFGSSTNTSPLIPARRSPRELQRLSSRPSLKYKNSTPSARTLSLSPSSRATSRTLSLSPSSRATSRTLSLSPSSRSVSRSRSLTPSSRTPNKI